MQYDWSNKRRKGEKVTQKLFDISTIAKKAPPTPASDRFDMLLFGRHRCGKSFLAATAADVPQLGKVAWIAFEDGTTSFSDRYTEDQITVFHPEDFSHAQQIVEALCDNESEYGTIVLDTLGEAQERVKREYLVKKGSGDYAMWDKIADGITYLVKRIHASKLNGIYIAHTEKVKDDTLGMVMLSPYFLGKKSVVDIPKIPDIIGYLAKVDTEEGPVRVLQLQSTERIDAGSRFEHKLPAQMENPTIAKIYEAITAK